MNSELLDRLKNDTENAVEYIFTKWSVRTIAILAKDGATAEEATEILHGIIYAILLRIQERPLKLRGEFEAYLTRACRYAWWRAKKKQLREGTLPDGPVLDDNPSIEEMIMIQERNALLWESIGKLSPECQAIISGVYEQGETLRSVGDRLGYSRNFINKKPRRCFNALLKIWSKDQRYNDYFL